MFKSCLFLVVVFLCMNGSFALAAEKEIRGVWVTRFEWTSEDPEICKENIREIFSSLGESNFNTALFQVRGSAETLYPSTLEPWSRLLGEKDPGFDPMQMAIDEARKNGVAIHAYINPMPLRETRWTEPPKDPKHIYHSHGPNSPDSWLCVDANGTPNTSEYYYMSAGIPEVQAYLRTVIMDLVRRYDLDGIHLDRIRYPGPEYSHDPVSKSRFRGRGNPNKLEWSDWQREQLDKFINDLAAEIRAEKPNVLLSCSAWGIYNRYHLDGYWNFSSGYHDYYQDTWNWCRLGAMDFLVPMIYWNMPEPKPNYDELVKDFVKGVGGDHLVGGQRIFSATENANQITFTREAGALGTVMFSHSSARRRGIMDACKETLYQEKAEVPTFKRVTEPESGTILGTVTAEDGKPLVDAWVTLRASEGSRGRRFGGGSRTWTSGADGRFAFLNVMPGNAQVRVSYPGASEILSETLEIKAGAVTKIDITVPDAKTVREEPFIDILSPSDGLETTDSVIHLLGRTSPDCHVTVMDSTVEVYSTGAFAR
ncbi:MAG TPA: family 10 glycosylhydrolase, partial [bacterium]|nr:family 10 glycosylhydrolase [bacterium]